MGNITVSFATKMGETMGSLSKPSCHPVIRRLNVDAKIDIPMITNHING